MHIRKLIPLIAAASLGLTGCRIGLLNTDPGIDVGQSADGRRVLLDTPRMWRDWTESVDREVQREIQGAKPSGGGTWNQRWTRSITSLQSGQHENPEKYIAYIVDTRQKAGLPELE